MFIYSIRASTVKLFGFVALTLLLIGVTLGFGGGEAVMAAAGESDINFSGIKTNEDRVEFINGFGIDVESEPMEEEAFTMPENFDRVILGYNEIQKKQGLDLSKYANKRVTRYTYKVTNYSSDGEVYANLFVYRSKIVACDVCSASPTGFVIPLTQVDKANLK